ncbi:hypothetical protein [Kineosporia babensis]|uniref:Uncharacterized protein n=1 Tax=Kineosporia babensis TaxID=499548 RepID=A0A9X1NI44_9ACTN|nr:hypothetical protein [Kineosporia babensis]MCD5314480.1 hypothetical protein [Kineosporia babensis]
MLGRLLSRWKRADRVLPAVLTGARPSIDRRPEGVWPSDNPNLTWSAPDKPWPGWDGYEQIRSESGLIDPQLQLRCIVGLAQADAPPGVKAFTFYGYLVGAQFVECEAEYEQADGSTGIFLPTVHWGYLYRLREALYLPGSGAWYSIRITVTEDGRFEADYDYEHEPTFSGPRQPSTYDYRCDTAWFTRDDEHTPDWLWHRLRGR